MTRENIISELTARPELNKEETIRLMAFVVEREGGFQLPLISSRPLIFPNRPPRGITVPLKTGTDIIAPEESLTEYLFLEAWFVTSVTLLILLIR